MIKDAIKDQAWHTKNKILRIVLNQKSRSQCSFSQMKRYHASYTYLLLICLLITPTLSEYVLESASQSISHRYLRAKLTQHLFKPNVEESSHVASEENELKPKQESTHKKLIEHDTNPKEHDKKPVTLTKTYKILYKKLVAATNHGKAWKNIHLQKKAKLSVPQIATVFYKLMFHVAQDSRKYFLHKYISLGYNLPKDMDLYGFCESNKRIQKKWRSIDKSVVEMIQLKKDHGDSTAYDADSLWVAVNAFKNVTKLEMDHPHGVWKKLKEDEKDAYLHSVRLYFRASSELAWGLASTIDILRQIELTQVVGKFMGPSDRLSHFKQPTDWYTPLISGKKQRSLKEFPNVLTELALLRHAHIETINTASGLELLGALIDPYLTKIKSFLERPNSRLYGVYTFLFKQKSSDAQVYWKVAKKYCTPNLHIRFCTLVPIMNQLLLFASTLRLEMDSNSVRTLPTPVANLKRTKYLEMLQDNLRHVQTSAEVNSLFEQSSHQMVLKHSEMLDKDLNGMYEEMSMQSHKISSKMRHVAEEYKNDGSFAQHASEARFNESISTMKRYSKDVTAILKVYSKLMKVISKAASDGATSQYHADGLGLLARVISTFISAGNNWDQTGLYADMGRMVQQLLKSAAADTRIKSGKLFFDGISGKKLKSVLKQLSKNLPKLQNLRKSGGELWKNRNITREKLGHYAATFLKAFAAYEQPLTAADIAEIQQIFATYQNELCRIALEHNNAASECVKATKYLNMFSKITKIVTLESDALNALADMSRNAVSSASATFFISAVDAALDDSQTSLKALDAKWIKEKGKNTQILEKMDSQLSYLRSVSVVHLVAKSVQLALAISTACNFFTYINVGVVIPPCVPILIDVTRPFDIHNLLSYRPNSAIEPSQRVVFIPTRPMYHGDTNYIALERLFLNRWDTHKDFTFQVPADETWLRKYNWIPPDVDLKDTVIYLRKFAPILPPLPVSKGNRVNGKQQTVRVMTESSSVSNLGPAVKGKRYNIPLRKFISEYNQQHFPPWIHADRGTLTSCKKPIKNIYEQCDPNAAFLCTVSEGLVDATSSDVLLPSLFSVLSISIQTSLALRYDAHMRFTEILSAPLAVHVELIYHNVKDMKKQDKRFLRARDQSFDEISSLQDQSDGRDLGYERKECCREGFVLASWKTKRCTECPVGKVSVFGGLYCTVARHGSMLG